MGFGFSQVVRTKTVFPTSLIFYFENWSRNILLFCDLNDVTLFSRTTHVFVKHRCPRRQQSQNMTNMTKISKSYILTPSNPQGHGMSVKCEEPLDELTVQVWLLYLQPNFNYWTLFVSGTELRTDKQKNRRTNGRTDDPITRCPGGPFRPGA